MLIFQGVDIVYAHMHLQDGFASLEALRPGMDFQTTCPGSLAWEVLQVLVYKKWYQKLVLCNIPYR